MRITNKQIIQELKSIEQKLPDNSNCVSNINKNFENISYNQSTMQSDMKEMIRICKDKDFGCGDK